MSWQPIPPADANGNITGYLVFYRPVLSSGETYNVVATSDMFIVLVDLAPGTQYVTRVLGSNAFGNGVSSQLVFTSTKVAGKINTLSTEKRSRTFPISVNKKHNQQFNLFHHHDQELSFKFEVKTICNLGTFQKTKVKLYTGKNEKY